MDSMNLIHALLKCFGERYIYNTKSQALLDLERNRDDMVGAFSAILDYLDKID